MTSRRTEAAALEEPSTSRSEPSLRLCLACTSGGHLSELEHFAGSLRRHEMFLVTVATPRSYATLSGIPKHYIKRIERNPANLVLNAFQAAHILIRDRPDVVISTGAGDTVPLMILAAAFGIPVVFIESVARVHSPSLTGRIVRRWVDLIILPWPSLRKAYPRGVLVAPLVRPGKPLRSLPANPSILVLTGTGPRGFNRLLQELDLLVETRRLDGRVFAQIGDSSYLPRTYAYERYLPHTKLLQTIQDCDLVITHDGAGSIREAAAAGKPIIIVPRDPKLGEVAYRSEADLANQLQCMRWATVVGNPSQIPSVLGSSEEAEMPMDSPPGPEALDVLLGFLEHLECKDHAHQRLDGGNHP